VVRQNFQQGKRQRELAKKQKREEKLQRRAEKKKDPSRAAEESGSEEQGVPSGEVEA
jgi:hypothetical protein